MSDSSVTPADSPVPTALLREGLGQLLAYKGMFAAESDIVLDAVLLAEAQGSAAFGLAYLAEIVQAMDLGDIDPRGATLLVRETAATFLLDGSRAVGCVAVADAVERARAMAPQAGAVIGVVRNGQPIGHPALFTRPLAAAGLVAWLASNTGRADLTLPGQTAPLAAEHRSAWSFPTPAGVLTISERSSDTTPRDLQAAHDRGEPVPEGLALDNSGRPTTNPAATRVVQSLTGAWGLPHAAAIGLLTAGLGGSRFATQKKKKSPFGDDSEHVLVVIDPKAFGTDLAAHPELPGWLDTLAAVPRDQRPGIELPAECPNVLTPARLPEAIPVPANLRHAFEEAAAKGKITLAWA